MTQNLIDIAMVDKDYGALKAVSNVDLTVSAGQCHALVGQNGAGKSTLIKIILGLVRVSSGTVQVLGMNPRDIAFYRLRATIGFLPEQVIFQGAMTGMETLKFYARLKGRYDEDLTALFGRVNLSAVASHRVGTYSKGMRQRLGLAQALIGKPRLLILDEPTSGLDPHSRKNIYQIIDEAKGEGTAVLIASHALGELNRRADTVTVLDRGKLMASGAIPVLCSNAGLSIQIRAQVAPEHMTTLTDYLTNKVSKDRFSCDVSSNTVTVDCLGDDKVSMLKRLLSIAVRYDDIAIIEPDLEDIFAAYTDQEAWL